MGDGEEVVVGGIIKVDQANAIGFRFSIGAIEFDFDAVANQRVEFAVGGDHRHRGASAGELGDGLVDGRIGNVPVVGLIESFGGGANAIGEDDIPFVGAARFVVEIGRFRGEAVERLEVVRLAPFLAQLGDEGLFDVVFGDEARHD